jgi:hypothetical protein
MPPPRFTLSITFSGICAFIPIAKATARKRTFVVMPGLEGAGNALDDEPLCPHDCYLRSPRRYLYDEISQIPLRGKRVSFVLEHATEPDESQLPDEAIDMQSLFGKYCILNPGIFRRRSPPRPSFVMTQVILPKGKFGRVTNPSWSIEAIVGGGGTPVVGAALAHEVIFTVNNLTKAILRLEELDGSQLTLEGSPQTHELRLYAKKKQVDLRIENTCKDLELLGPGQQPRRDRDFKWYYELLDEDIKKTIRDKLGNSDLPIPRSAGYHVAGDHDCFPARVGY